MNRHSGLPFSSGGAAEPASRFYTMSPHHRFIGLFDGGPLEVAIIFLAEDRVPKRRHPADA